ncbi:MAG: hypothetical protein JNL67_20520 [Planctomycetaceae bacterium]|nr:hypothetical protein [Planctomycetaceae bacterium]
MSKILRLIACLSVFALTSKVLGVQGNPDNLWHRYVAAISRLQDVECSFELHDRLRGIGEGFARGDGYYLNGEYSLFRFNLPHYFWYVKRKNFEYEYLPPHDWTDRVEYHSDQGGGVFLETECTLSRSKSHIPYMVPHPVCFFTGGMFYSLDRLTNAAEWTIGEKGGRLILESKSEDRRIELELDPEHGWLPKLAEHHYKSGMVAQAVDEFHNVNGLWFPIKMRSIRSDRKNEELVVSRYHGHRLIVDKSSLRINPRLPLESYRFQPPAGSIIHDLDSRESIRGEVGLAKMAEFRSAVRLRNQVEPSGWSMTLSAWVALASFAVFMICCIFWLLRTRGKAPKLACVLLFGLGALPQLGCGESNESKQYMKSSLQAKEVTRAVTAPPGVAVEGTELFLLTNTSEGNVELLEPISNCSCIKEMKFDKVNLQPNETVQLQVRYLQKVGMNPQKYQIGFSANTISGKEAHRVFLQIVPDRNWDVHLPSRLKCTIGIPTDFEFSVTYDESAPELLSIVSPEGILVSDNKHDEKAGTDTDNRVVRYRATAKLEGPARTGTVEFLFAASNKRPVQLAKPIYLIVDPPLKFDAPSYFWDGESVRLPIIHPTSQVVTFIGADEALQEILSTTYDSTRSEILVERRGESAMSDVLPLTVRIDTGSSIETITTTLVLNR